MTTHGDAPPDRSDRDEGGSILGRAAGIQFGALFAAVLVGNAFLIDHTTQKSKPGAWPVVFGLLPLWAVLLAGIRQLRVRRGFHAEGPRPWLVVRDLPWLVVGAATQFASALLYLPFDVKTEDLEKPAKELINSAGGRNVGFAALAVALGVGAPIVEELFYRGVIWRGSSLMMRDAPVAWKRRVVPILVSALWFGAVHFEPLQFPALALVGAICAYAASREGRIAPAVLVHMGFNLVTVVALGMKL